MQIAQLLHHAHQIRHLAVTRDPQRVPHVDLDERIADLGGFVRWIEATHADGFNEPGDVAAVTPPRDQKPEQTPACDHSAEHAHRESMCTGHQHQTNKRGSGRSRHTLDERSCLAA